MQSNAVECRQTFARIVSFLDCDRSSVRYVALVLVAGAEESRDGASGRRLGHPVALPGQARPVPLQEL